MKDIEKVSFMDCEIVGLFDREVSCSKVKTLLQGDCCLSCVTEILVHGL